MKFKILFFTFCLIKNFVFCQQQNIVVNYIFKIEIPDGGSASFNKILKSNEEYSTFIDSGAARNVGRGKVMVNDKNIDFGLFQDRTRDNSIYYSPIFNKNFYVKEDSMLGLFKWKLIDSLQKKILDFNCKAATCYFRGRNYTAYYTEEVAISAGPWKFCGLPGLILEISTTDNKYSYTAFKFASQIEKINISNPYNNVDAKFLSFKEHKKIFLKKLFDSQNKMRTDEKDTDIELNISDNSMELLQ